MLADQRSDAAAWAYERFVGHRFVSSLGEIAMAQTRKSERAAAGHAAAQDGVLVRIAIAFTAWAERWFPDAFIFVAIAVVVVALAALANGASPAAVSQSFGNGFWSLITF